MIDHVSIGVRHIGRTKRFYDAAFGAIGYKCLAAGEDYLGYGRTSIRFWVGVTRSPVPRNRKSGLHFCVRARSRASVQQFFRLGLRNGGKSNGRPGMRKDNGPGYYAAYLIDPDGYRLEAVFHSRR